jgi:Luciferase
VKQIMKLLTELRETVSAWPHVSVHPHRFGSREFRYGRAEIGHVHEGGVVDIPFTMPIHDVLLAGNLAEEHHFVPDSGWITFRMRTEEDLAHAVRLLRLSYLRYALKTAVDPHHFLQQESATLHLTPELQSLLEPFVPAKPVLAAANAS